MGEPWCFLPVELAKLTDMQIVKRYFAPRDEHGRLLEPPSLSIATAVEPELPPREVFIAEMVSQFGETEEHWGETYDKMITIEAGKNGQIENAGT